MSNHQPQNLRSKRSRIFFGNQPRFASNRLAIVVLAATLCSGCSHTASTGFRDVPRAVTETQFGDICTISNAIIVDGFMRGTFEGGDFVFPDTLGFASDPGPLGLNPAAKHIVLDDSDERDRAILRKAPNNGVSGWSHVWSVSLLVTPHECDTHLKLIRILTLTPISASEYERLYLAGRAKYCKAVGSC